MLEKKVKVLETACFLRFNYDYYAMINLDQFREYFIPDYKNITTNINDKAEIYITSVYSTNADNYLFSNSKVNILICIENIKNTRSRHYTHYNQFGEYGDDRINIYYYNHIDKIKITDKYLAIPTVYFRIDYFKLKYDYYKTKLNVPFKEKKFCLMVNKSGVNNKINEYVKKLNEIELVDHISKYNNKIEKKSCYNSIELLEVFNQYKFILCVENSYNDGYITEKIFNVFFSKAIPIYDGSDKIEYFFNNKSFVNIKSSDDYIKIVKKLNDDEKLYNEYINNDKINKDYDDEDYKNKMRDFIEKLL